MKQLILKILCFLLIGGWGKGDRVMMVAATNKQFKNKNEVTWDSTNDISDDDVVVVVPLLTTILSSESNKRASNLNSSVPSSSEQTQENVTNNNNNNNNSNGDSRRRSGRHKRDMPMSLCAWKCNCINENNFLTVDCDLLQPEVSDGVAIII